MLSRTEQKTVPLILLCLLAALLAACGPVGAGLNNLPTPLSSEYLPTAIALTIEANRSLTTPATNPFTSTPTGVSPSAQLALPTSTASPTRQAALASYTPSITPTPNSILTSTLSPTPTLRPTRTPKPSATATPGMPNAVIQILSPGPQSKIISPMTITAAVKPGSSGRVQIDLLGEDGRLLGRKLIRYNPDVTQVYLSEKLDFAISAVAEAALLQIITYDQYDRITALAGVNLILLSIGENDINPPGLLNEKAVFLEPPQNKLIQGGVLVVSGLARFSSGIPVLAELITATGKAVGYRQLPNVVSPDGSYLPFRVEIPYTVTTPTWVRLVLSEEGETRIPGKIYITSMEVLLSP